MRRNEDVQFSVHKNKGNSELELAVVKPFEGPLVVRVRVCAWEISWTNWTVRLQKALFACSLFFYQAKSHQGNAGMYPFWKEGSAQILVRV